ncbi:MAG TPA: hypothetical protein VHS53_04775 [Mucilaginibacter sp.]|jgi:hypothetical protein|nr:hypothetical protein [Mucilaginibacter sp.]
MKTLKPFLVSLTLLIIPFCRTFAQKPAFNYVLTVKGDTIKCEFKRPLLGKIRYVPVGSDKAVKITTEGIKEYYTAKDTTLVVAAVLPGDTDPEFINLLERGRINMYEKVVITYSRYGSNTSYYWYVNKDNDPLKELKATTIFTDGSRKERKKMFSEILADNIPLQGQFEADNDFSLKRLQYYIHEYNQSKTGEVKVTGK